MNKKRLIISSVISIFLVSVLLLGSTYSIFTSQEIDEIANVYKTGNLNVTYKVSSNTVHFTDPTPMTVEEADSVIPYRITVTNSGNVPYEFDVILLDTTSSTDNTIDYQYIMTKVGYLEPKLLSDCTNNIIKENVIVPAGKSVDIDIRIWLDSTLSNTEIGKSFYAKLKIDGLAVYNDDEYIDNSKLSLRYMNTTSGLNYFNSDTYRNYIITASFVDYIDTSNASINNEINEKIMWDMSTAQDESVIAWLEDNGEMDELGNKLYDLYIGSKEKIYISDLRAFFMSMRSLNNIIFSNLSTALTISFGQNIYLGAFQNCISLISLDLSSFNTRNVIYMSGLFSGCTNLISLDLSSFDTSSVVSMSRMFMDCFSITSLDISGFDTSNVIDMTTLFKNCRSLIELDVSNFDTSNVTDMSSMFCSCEKLKNLDVSNFDTSNVTAVGEMFSRCKSLTKLDLSNFDTSNIEIMWYMFSGCISLTELDVSNFDTSCATRMEGMFSSCLELVYLNLGDFDTSNVINMNGMFSNSGKLITSITIKNTSSPTYNEMFRYAATAEGAQIIVNYVDESTEALVEAMIATKSTNSNVVKGELVA